MLKPTANYKMSKQTKASLALGGFKNAHAQGQWKRAMINAELSSMQQYKPSRGKRDDKGE
jgi:hypothetical protein